MRNIKLEITNDQITNNQLITNIPACLASQPACQAERGGQGDALRAGNNSIINCWLKFGYWLL
jgi:hypothetical protein